MAQGGGGLSAGSRSVAVGAGAGLVAGVAVGGLMAVSGMPAVPAVGPVPAWALFGGYGALTGAALGLLHGRRPPGLAGAVSGGMTAGLLGWLIWFLTLDPILRGQSPTWSAAFAGASYRELVGSLLAGGLTGALLRLAARRVPEEPAEPGPAPKVVIVGGGFAGVAAAQGFEHLALRGHRADVTLVSATNFLLFTPMLAEVASGALEPQHISAPARAAAPLTRFRHGTAEHVDLARRTVIVDTGTTREALPYDQLLIAVGSVPNFPGLPGGREHAFTLKNLDDARILREHVLGLLERADSEPDAAERRRLLTFVVAGGGFAGTETVAELFDLVHGVLHYYPGVSPKEPRFILVHSRERILPELSAELGAYALERLRARGIEFRLGVRAAAAGPAEVTLTDGERIPTRTFVWTAGQRASSLVETLPGERGRQGALVTDACFRVRGVDGVWAIGDCAQIPDGGESDFFPPTAQHALREGKHAAKNIVAALEGREPAPFRFRTIGVFVALGHRTAAGEIRGRRFSGLSAWLLWRGIYLAKLPGIEKRARVLFDWTLDLAFPRDIAVTAPPVAAPPVVASRPLRATPEEAR